jgi:hypothetical protein
MLTSLMKDIPQYKWIASGYEKYHSPLDGLKFIGLIEQKSDLFFSKLVINLQDF